MEILLGFGLFSAGVVLFVLTLLMPENGSGLIARLMRSEYSALVITIMFGIGMALAVDGALSLGAGIGLGVAIALIGLLGVAGMRVSARRSRGI